VYAAGVVRFRQRVTAFTRAGEGAVAFSSMDEVRAVYGWRTAGRWLFVVVMLAVTAVVVPMLVGLAVTVSAPAAVLLFAVVAGWLTLIGLLVWRLALTLEVTATELRWRTAVRRGAIPLVELARVGPVPVLSIGGVHHINTVWVMVSNGFTELVDDLRDTAPAMRVRLSVAVRRMPGRNQYRRLNGR